MSDQLKLSRSAKIAIMVFFVGTALIVAGQSVYGYANQWIEDLEAKSSQAGLSQNEYWDVEGALNWWRQASISIYGPISIILITAGIAVLIFLTAYFALKISRSKRT